MKYKYRKLIKNIENNGIGVNKIIETSDSIGLELTQFTHPSIEIIEEIIASAKMDAGINKTIKKDYNIYWDLLSRENFLYKGIAFRAFEKKFQLADNIKIKEATLKNGLLNIDLLKILPKVVKKEIINIIEK